MIVPPRGVKVRRVFTRIRSETQSAFSAEAPVHSAARRHDTGHLSAEVLLQRRPPGDELEAEPVIDHCEAARGERDALALDAGDMLALHRRMVR